MLQQPRHHVVFAFLDQEGGESKYSGIPIVTGQRIAGRHIYVVYASQQGHWLILALCRSKPLLYKLLLQMSGRLFDLPRRLRSRVQAVPMGHKRTLNPATDTNGPRYTDPNKMANTRLES
jgi:hypothetical protein